MEQNILEAQLNLYFKPVAQKISTIIKDIAVDEEIERAITEAVTNAVEDFDFKDKAYFMTQNILENMLKDVITQAIWSKKDIFEKRVLDILDKTLVR